MKVYDCHILRIFQQSSHIFLHKIAFLMAILIFIVFLLPTERWGAGMVICLERGADLHMAQLMPLPLLASVKSKLVLPFWYRLTWVVPEKGLLNGCVCVCVLLPTSITFCYLDHLVVAKRMVPSMCLDPSGTRWGSNNIWHSKLQFTVC